MALSLSSDNLVKTSQMICPATRFAAIVKKGKGNREMGNGNGNWEEEGLFHLYICQK